MLDLIGQTLTSSDASLLQAEETIWNIVGTSRTLEGILKALPTRVPYLAFFNWV